MSLASVLAAMAEVTSSEVPTLDALGLALYCTPARDQGYVAFSVTSEVRVYSVYREVPVVSLELSVRKDVLTGEERPRYMNSYPLWILRQRAQLTEELVGAFPLHELTAAFALHMDPLSATPAAGLLEERVATAASLDFRTLAALEAEDLPDEIVRKLNTALAGPLLR